MIRNSGKLSLTQILDPPYVANPYPLYHQLRQHDPVYWDEQATGWVLTQYTDIVGALRDSRLSSQRFRLDTATLPQEMQTLLKPPAMALARQMLSLDPPDHTRLRRLANKAFTPRFVENMSGPIQQIVEELLVDIPINMPIDLMRHFAYPLPIMVIARMLGVPPKDHKQFAHWASYLAALFESFLDGALFKPGGITQALYGIHSFMKYFRAVIAQRRITPQEDLLQGLIAAEEQGDVLNEEELLGNCILLLSAGHMTTTHLFGNGLLALLQHPEQFQQLRDDPSLMPSAVQELLRYDGPIQSTGRLAGEDLNIGEKHIKSGEAVIVCLGAANRDPNQFPDPDQFTFDRKESRSIAFGHGIHFCLGAPLARLEGQIALSILLERFQTIRLATDVEALEWRPGVVFRGLKALPVIFA